MVEVVFNYQLKIDMYSDQIGVPHRVGEGSLWFAIKNRRLTFFMFIKCLPRLSYLFAFIICNLAVDSNMTRYRIENRIALKVASP